jgi:two-component system cell cycle response regulator DivK
MGFVYTQSASGQRPAKEGTSMTEDRQSKIGNRKSKILLIEDNANNRYLTTFILEKHGYEVFQAVDGQAGIALACQLKPDLILLDIQLPVMDGYAVARALTQNPELQHIPIIAVTSYAMAGDRERVLAAGCAGYIEKPINPETFVAEVEQHLAARQAGGMQKTRHD